MSEAVRRVDGDESKLPPNFTLCGKPSENGGNQRRKAGWVQAVSPNDDSILARTYRSLPV